MVDLNKEVQYIKGVGPNRVALLNRLGMQTLGDIITFFPREHEDRSRPKSIFNLINGEEALISAYPIGRMNTIRIRNNMTICKLFVRDETGIVEINWYNQTYLKNNFTTNKRYNFFGKISVKNGKITMQSPVFDIDGSNRNTGKIIPIYPLTYKLSQNTLRKIIENGISEVYGKLDETLPDYIIEKYKLCDINTAMKQIHFPDNFQSFNYARRRLVFEELFSMQLALLKLKKKYDVDRKGISFSQEIKMSDVINDLPYKLTGAQLRVLEEIDKDMESSKPMNRLLQGDVGSGKTVVAMVSAYKCVKAGYQAVIMAPTAILAGQHMESFTQTLGKYGIRSELLVSGLTKKNKTALLERLKKGEIDVLIGTHAVFEDNVEYVVLAKIDTGYELDSWSTTANGILASSNDNPAVKIPPIINIKNLIYLYSLFSNSSTNTSVQVI